MPHDVANALREDADFMKRTRNKWNKMADELWQSTLENPPSNEQEAHAILDEIDRMKDKALLDVPMTMNDL